jgi:hypothetical protein
MRVSIRREEKPAIRIFSKKFDLDDSRLTGQIPAWYPHAD